MNLKKFLEIVEKSYVNVRFIDEEEGWPSGLVQYDKDLLFQSEVISVNFKDETFYIVVQDLRNS